MYYWKKNLSLLLITLLIFSSACYAPLSEKEMEKIIAAAHEDVRTMSLETTEFRLDEQNGYKVDADSASIINWAGAEYNGIRERWDKEEGFFQSENYQNILAYTSTILLFIQDCMEKNPTFNNPGGSVEWTFQLTYLLSEDEFNECPVANEWDYACLVLYVEKREYVHFELILGKNENYNTSRYIFGSTPGAFSWGLE